jgi:hypothetical protein
MAELLETKLEIESNLKGRRLLVKGYYITSEIEEFTPEEIAIHYINKFYLCPICNKIKRGWAIYEEKNNGLFIRRLFLECKHEFTTLKGLGILDIDYEDMFSMFIIIKANDKQLIQRAKSLIRPFMHWISTWNSTTTIGSAAGGRPAWRTSVIRHDGSIGVNAQGPTLASPVGNTDYGILLGSLNPPNDTNTFALAQKILHGTAAGQLLYGATTISDIIISGSTFILNISRIFQNGSPGIVTIREVALVMAIYQHGDSTLYFSHIARDILATPFDASVGSAFTTYYRLSLTVS